MISEAALDISIAISKQDRDLTIGMEKGGRYAVMQIEKSAFIPDEYEGPYEATSKLYYSRFLQTKNKMATENIEIKPIPIYEVANPKGGITVTIGDA